MGPQDTELQEGADTARTRRLRLILMAGLGLGVILAWAGCRQSQPPAAEGTAAATPGVSAIPGRSSASGAVVAASGAAASTPTEVKHDVGQQLREELKGVVGGSAGKYNPFEN